MNKIGSLAFAATLSVACVFVSGCYTPPVVVDKSPKFREDAYASVVVRFYRWDNFFIVRPDCREDGFLRPMKPNELHQAFDTLHVRRDMAVVVMASYGLEEQTQIIENWKSLLSSQGFRRVVCLRGADDDKKLDGLRIIEDWKQSVDQPKQTAGL